MQQQNIVALTLQLYVYTEHAIRGFKLSAFSGIWYAFVVQICSNLCRIWIYQVTREQEHFQWSLDKKGGGKISIKKGLLLKHHEIAFKLAYYSPTETHETERLSESVH